jgi:hypothetical protein
MMTSVERVASFRKAFLDLIEDVEKYALLCRGATRHKEAIPRLKAMHDDASALKTVIVADKAEEEANELLAYEYMLKALASEMAMYLALKADDAGKAWNLLVDAQMAAKHAVQSHKAAAHLDREYIPRLYLLERLLFPRQVFFSVGMVVHESQCSICDAVYGDCNHIKGEPYMGRLCARIIKRAEHREVSIVTEPANKRCRVVSFTDDDGTAIDPLSLLPANQASETPPTPTEGD